MNESFERCFSPTRSARSLRWLCAVVALTVLLAGAAPSAAANGTPAVDVTIDPRIELMGVIQLLDGYFLVTDHEFPYKWAAAAYFDEHADHEAVTLFHAMVEDGFGFDAVPRALLALTPPPELAQRIPFHEDVIERAGGEERLERWVAALRDFARETSFMTFFDAHRGAFARSVETREEPVRRATATLGEYTGLPLPPATVIFGLLLHDGGFGAIYRHPDGAVEAFSVVGPAGVEDGLPDFRSGRALMTLLWHEALHGFVNPLTAQNEERILLSEALFEPMAEAMEKEGYGRWTTVVNEEVIRALEVRLVDRVLGPEAAAAELADELDRGFVHVDELAGRLEAYERDRDRYPTLVHFYPRLLDVFAEAVETDGSHETTE